MRCGRDGIRHQHVVMPLWAGWLWLVAACPVHADQFTFVNESGETETVEARLMGSGQEVHALETADGRVRIVPQAAVQKREVAEGPAPLSVAEMIALLQEEFGKDKVRAMESAPYVPALVLAGPVEPAQESKVRAYLRTAATFLGNVDKVFASYARLMRFDLEKPRFPLVMLIFEADEDFEAYTRSITGGQGLSAGNISGFYSPLTNWLAVRMGECFTFEVPLHEAIHQQVFNRGVFQRLAPTPAWFNEGIATGFENEGDRIAGNPSKVNVRYARLAQRATTVSWADVVRDDSAFRGDVLAGEAYTHAWCLHWMLAIGHTEAYRRYVQELGGHEPLQELSEEERLKHFEEVFGKPVAELQRDFPRQLQLAAKRQKLSFADEQTPGQSVTQSGPAEVKLEAVSRVDQGGLLTARGSVKNLSPFRDWTLYVVVETTSGMYADWLLPSVRSGQSAPLNPQAATKVMRGARGGPASSYRVHVRAAAPGSDEAKAWIRGELPASP
jgi:hypothetical protein